MKPSLTVLVPGLNVGLRADETARGLLVAGQGLLETLKLILVDDGSTDDTGAVMDALAREFPGHVSVIHNEEPKGVGTAFKTGLALCDTDYYAVCPGDNAYDTSTLTEALKNLGKRQLILTYRTNQFESRAPVRFFLSWLFSLILRWLFWIQVKDMHSMNIYPTQLARELSLPDDVSVQMKLVLGLLRKGVSYAQFPMLLNSAEKHGKSRFLRLASLVAVTKTALRLFLSR